MTLKALAELDAAPTGTSLTAGSDFMVKTRDGRWYRHSDDSFHTSENLADFHGHSGYSLMPPDNPEVAR
jgi:hypothetical protein